MPTSDYDLLAMTPEELARVDIALMNLLCAKGLPGAENRDIPPALRKRGEWGAKVRFETERHLYRGTDPRHAEHYANSEAPTFLPLSSCPERARPFAPPR
jgi:hypothetical protein